jgi:hypothetical protein
MPKLRDFLWLSLKGNGETHVTLGRHRREAVQSAHPPLEQFPRPFFWL